MSTLTREVRNEGNNHEIHLKILGVRLKSLQQHFSPLRGQVTKTQAIVQSSQIRWNIGQRSVVHRV